MVSKSMQHSFGYGIWLTELTERIGVIGFVSQNFRLVQLLSVFLHLSIISCTMVILAGK